MLPFVATAFCGSVLYIPSPTVLSSKYTGKVELQRYYQHNIQHMMS